MSMITMHLKDPLVLFGSEGSSLTLPLFHLSARIIMLLSLFFNNDKGPLFGYILWHLMTFVCRCAFKHSFIYSLLQNGNI